MAEILATARTWEGRPDDPKNFRAIMGLLRGSTSTMDLSKVFEAVEDIAYREVSYYYMRRRRMMAGSYATRIFGFSAGILSLVCTQLAAANVYAPGSAIMGAIALTVAGAAFACNTLFNLTAGHIRYVATQLSLENLIVRKRLEWSAAFGGTTKIEPDATKMAEAYTFISLYVTETHAMIAAETSDWAAAIMEAMKNHRDSVDKMIADKEAAERERRSRENRPSAEAGAGQPAQAAEQNP